MIKDKLKLDLLNKSVTKLIDDTKKPMSILQIKEKYNLSFPFQVKRVKFTYSNQDMFGSLNKVFIVQEIKKESDGYVVYIPYEERFKLCAEIQDYILFEEN